MRDHIRRDAGQYIDAAWWLVPVAFAAAALAAVAFTDGQAGEDDTQTIVHAGAAAATPAPAVQPVNAQVLPQPADSSFEVTEHVQAF